MQLGYDRGMALVRIAFGLYFFWTGVGKATSGWLSSPDTLMNQFFTPLLPRSEVWYRPFLEGVAIPNALLFGQLVTCAEIAVGIALTLGLLTRPAAVVGMFLNLNYMLMKGLLNPAGSTDRMFFVAQLALFLTAAGLVWGLDRWLRPYLPAWLTGTGADGLPAGQTAGVAQPAVSR